jgi:hypothetical protein
MDKPFLQPFKPLGRKQVPTPPSPRPCAKRLVVASFERVEDPYVTSSEREEVNRERARAVSFVVNCAARCIQPNAKRHHTVIPFRLPKTLTGTTTSSPNSISNLDPTMSSSRQHLQNRIAVLRVFVQQNHISGILPSGWLEKNLHALPSTLFLVTELYLENTIIEQAKLEQHLTNTLDTLNGSCAKKRNCAIHLMCLVKASGRGPVSPSLAEVEWLVSMRSICRLGSNRSRLCITLKKMGTGTSATRTAFFELELLLLSLQKVV